MGVIRPIFSLYFEGRGLDLLGSCGKNIIICQDYSISKYVVIMGVNGTKLVPRAKSVSIMQISYSVHLAIEGIMEF